MTGTDASIFVGIITAAVACVLYVATYRSFVYLLRYPRNWISPSLPESLATGALAITVVAFVSLSADGLDILSLAVSSVFITALFIIIAAPAYAFQPASRPVEFLAKHGDYAGLWLLGPALIAGLAIPNIKLQAVMFTAMAVEAMWFARQRLFARAGRLYPLKDRDLSVLKTQAKDDLKAFQRRHHIRELVLSNGEVSWRGCEKSTAPCPFNLYVNRLGLNTAPCCREQMKDLSHYVAGALSNMGAVHWLEGGSLLGAIRENGALLDWEDDVDISVLLTADMTWDKVTARLVEDGARDGFYVDIFKKNGFISISADQPRRWFFRPERNRMRGEIRADIAIYRQVVSFGETVLERCSKKGAMPTTEGGGFGVPMDIVLPTATTPFLGGEIACPGQPDAYLEILYGDFKKIEYTYLDPVAAKARANIDAENDLVSV
ncbi:MAG: LicD family protein [Alphaproteobacteria bacterium]|nr:LicD family protein [Alphaproteobacteria bacterium]